MKEETADMSRQDASESTLAAVQLARENILLTDRDNQEVEAQNKQQGPATWKLILTSFSIIFCQFAMV
jgi:hypothetical protein